MNMEVIKAKMELTKEIIKVALIKLVKLQYLNNIEYWIGLALCWIMIGIRHIPLIPMPIVFIIHIVGLAISIRLVWECFRKGTKVGFNR